MKRAAFSGWLLVSMLKRVSEYSEILARELSLPDTQIDTLKISATLHDVGKIVVNDDVLNKKVLLYCDEFE